MVVPSGDKATEDTACWLCALCFSAFSFREAAAQAQAVSFRLRAGGRQFSTPASMGCSGSKEAAGVAFSSDGATILSGSHDKTIKVWDAGVLAWTYR